MIEGVEALIIAEHLKKYLQNRDVNDDLYISNISVNNQYMIKNSNVDYHELINKKILYKNISTFGRVLILPFEDNYHVCFVFAISGKLTCNKNKSTIIDFEIISGTNCFHIYYEDNRRLSYVIFGKDGYYSRNINCEIKNSVEWRDPDCAVKFAERVVYLKVWRESIIRRVLANKMVISGPGNFYSCEGLFHAKINPRALVKDLSYEQRVNLINCLRNNMIRFYNAGGLPQDEIVSDNYQTQIKRNMTFVFNRKARPCRMCKNAMIQTFRTFNFNKSMITIYYCPSCQG